MSASWLDHLEHCPTCHDIRLSRAPDDRLCEAGKAALAARDKRVARLLAAWGLPPPAAPTPAADS